MNRTASRTAPTFPPITPPIVAIGVGALLNVTGASAAAGGGISAVSSSLGIVATGWGWAAAALSLGLKTSALIWKHTPEDTQKIIKAEAAKAKLAATRGANQRIKACSKRVYSALNIEEPVESVETTVQKVQFELQGKYDEYKESMKVFGKEHVKEQIAQIIKETLDHSISPTHIDVVPLDESRNKRKRGARVTMVCVAP
jgi:hypothetical protein